MKRRALAFGDRVACWVFVRVLRWWHWRTGKPAVVAMYSPEIARGEWHGGQWAKGKAN